MLDDTAPPADIDWQKVELPDLEAESGRGLALAQTVLDGLRHDRRPDGNTWTLWRTLPDGADRG